MSNFLIKSIQAREILDSRGNPTVEAECILEDGIYIDSVPSGASKGEKEAVELRDNNKDRFGGKGVLKAVKNVNEIIAPRLVGLDVRDQKKIDEIMLELDGTPNKSNLGANAILPVSMAVCRAAAAALREPLYQYIADLAKNRNSLFIPKGFFNVINGGAHAGNELDFQEFMLVPQNENFVENLRMASETYYKLKSILIENYSLSAINVGDEGGFAPPIDSPEIALGLISEAIEQANFYGKIDINLDIAASQFSGQKLGYYQTKMGIFNRDDFIDYYENLLNNYHIIGLEDPFGENDWEGFQQIMTHFSKRIMIIGDDLLATNINYIKQAQEKKACNAALIKLNQVGTITECLAAVNEAKKNEWKIIVSHRSGETIDDFIADLAVGVGADGLKAGAPARGERVCKYNRLLKIESEIYKEI
ncbi:MAG TPA: phosphopyruvate hydratase [Candidatus Pacearchaeota archaeon]|jgi:enolase|nr:phosphopyruvate hydratase [Candidatus Pacearchaeota archaeon]HPC30631.1 phosphopyruvate hydratase [Candidatus Pacearchaeota archaeon]HQH20258.1 phosphopyruvate hydratase [Candidatus Pacearchaeota archaeon]HQK58486.1 phosphopyruvate hydratase [Candidatus Pacearchaeota archaeon]HRU20945.1 phosphopyruvate hydratase [Candidatus Paceibacterota bacterium]